MHGHTLTDPVKQLTLADFLRARGTQLSDVVAVASEALHVGTGDILLAAGSVVEGFGNIKSDLDLLLLTPAPERHLTATDRTVVVGQCLSDVEVLPLDSVNALLARFDQWCARSWDVSHAAGFSLEQRRLLHRLLHGVALRDGTPCSVSSVRPRQEGLARLKLHVARHMGRTIQVDMAGYREAGDFASLGFAAQELLGHAVDALAAGYLLTNPTPKWRSRILATLPADWSRSLGIRPTGASAHDFLWRLHRAPEWPHPDAILDHAVRIVTFARAAFLWAERALLRPALERRVIPERLAESPAGPPLPCLDLDVDFAEQDHGAALARLNEFGDVVELSPRDLDIALFFDGVTTAADVACAVFGQPSVSARRHVEDLAATVAASGFCHGAVLGQAPA